MRSTLIAILMLAGLGYAIYDREAHAAHAGSLNPALGRTEGH